MLCSLPSLPFGQFLIKRQLIGFDELFRARMLMKRMLMPVGEMAIEKGWMRPADVEYVLNLQRLGGGMFCDVALREGLLSRSQADVLINEQRESSKVFCAALQELGIMMGDELDAHVSEYEQTAV